MFKAFSKLFQKKNIEVLPKYQGWRNGIFTVTSEQVGISKDIPNKVYGVIMDVGLANEDGSSAEKNLVISETAFATGESSMQTSFGGGVLGLGSNQEISGQAKQIISAAQLLINTSKPTKNYPLPESGNVYFYFLTTSGIGFYECKFIDLNSKGHPYGEIFSRFSVIKNEADRIWYGHSNKESA